MDYTAMIHSLLLLFDFRLLLFENLWEIFFWMKMKNWFSLLLQHACQDSDDAIVLSDKDKITPLLVKKCTVQIFLGSIRLPNCFVKKKTSSVKVAGVSCSFSLVSPAMMPSGEQGGEASFASPLYLLLLYFKCQLSHSKSCVRQRASLTLGGALC